MHEKKTRKASRTSIPSCAGKCYPRLRPIRRGHALTSARIKNILHPVFEKKGAIKALLFGSYARGTEDAKSDIDLLIIQNTDKRFLDRFQDFKEIYSLLQNHAIDLLIYSPDELERNRHRPFLKKILSDAVTLYER